MLTKSYSNSKDIAKEVSSSPYFQSQTKLYDLILFVTHSFVQPIVTELYALKHNDVTVANDLSD